ncbi:hypothetical protein OF829_14885 [Sphingomonas sp. LB-2]|uniref:DUF4139 domain-containing protein n=1 Tax=Sphingomonas caeni TaxID=2984949 RepID=UPI00222F83A1|nr:hypothetical protein [Sphingomonas caeni]MCW3848524.1 hypothetical protein [Sphingomonas caeni]
MRTIRALILLLAALAAWPAFAQPAITSPGPDTVSVTIYTVPGGGRLDLSWLQGYALITEKRTVRIPAGRSVIRFEGVASGIFPESALITGLPDGVLEKNLDADLLSPRSLYARSFGRPVMLTHRNANGTMVSERAIIRSAPGGAAIFETRDGFITADCTGSEAIVYDDVPAGLSAKPTLSIETNSPVEREVTLSLSYLAWGFDWQVNYVATMRPDGKRADLVAWVTLASGDMTSFADAETMVVAGAINREEDDDDSRGRFGGDQSLRFQCMATHVDRVVAEPVTVDAISAEDVGQFPNRNVKRNSDTVVDAITAEDLGDVKLYRVPERTTVASNSQKQVLLFDRPSVPVEIVYRAEVGIEDNVYPISMLLRLDNTKARGLGIPLPRGDVALFEPLGERRLLAGEGSIYDRAVGERIDIDMGEVDQVSAGFVPAAPKRGWESRVLTATNANPYPVQFEARIDLSDQTLPVEDRGKPRRVRGDAPLSWRNGKAYWSVEIPANSTVTLRLRK